MTVETINLLTIVAIALLVLGGIIFDITYVTWSSIGIKECKEDDFRMAKKIVLAIITIALLIIGWILLNWTVIIID